MLEEEKKEELLALLTGKKYRELKSQLVEMNEVDIASFIEELDSEKTVVVFRMLPKELASEVFACLEVEQQQHIITSITDNELRAIIDDLYVDDAVDMLEELPATIVRRVLQNSSPDTRKLINQFLNYPENSAGSVMTAEYVGLKKNMTVEQAFDYIRKYGVDKETIYTCYVTDNRKKLLGVVTVKDLLLADPDEKIEMVMDSSVISVETLEDKESVALELSDYDFLALPVVDKEGCIVGIVTVDDAIDVMQEEATEDIQKMAAMLPNEKPYLKQSVWSIWKARIPWLLLLMISATFTSMILSGYEESLAALASGAVLYSFVPMLMDTAGNAGGQSSVTVIRSLALGDVELKDVFRILWKELRAALLLGLTVSVVCFAKLMLIDRLYNDVTVKVALIVSSVLFITILLAKLIGCTLPLLAKKCRLDPAVVASPFITTIVDALSLIIYCSIAIALL